MDLSQMERQVKAQVGEEQMLPMPPYQMKKVAESQSVPLEIIQESWEGPNSGGKW